MVRLRRAKRRSIAEKKERLGQGASTKSAAPPAILASETSDWPYYAIFASRTSGLSNTQYSPQKLVVGPNTQYLTKEQVVTPPRNFRLKNFCLQNQWLPHPVVITSGTSGRHTPQNWPLTKPGGLASHILRYWPQTSRRIGLK